MVRQEPPPPQLKVVRTDQHRARLQAGDLYIELSAIFDDVFRLRMARRREFQPSWAVVPPENPTVSASVKKSARAVKLETGCGRFHLDLVAGAWEITDHFGLSVFSSPPGATGITESGPETILQLQEDEALFGLGESSGTFNKRGLIREFWNIDVGGHSRLVHANLRNMYVSIPFALSLRHGRAAGLFWDNPGRQTWDLGQTKLDAWRLQAATGELDLYFFLGPTLPEILERWTTLTGRMAMPPAWGLGYQQCRYSYESRARVEEIARTFRRKRIPCDVLYLDIHYMDGYRVFTFGKSFPRPAQMLEALGRNGFKVVTIIDPGVKDDPKFPVLQRGLARNAFVKSPNGKADYLGQVWPGVVRFPDFLNARTRAWWGEEQARFQKLGVAGFWNDMNEPADFSAPQKDFPANCQHETELGPVQHGTVHNVYGSQMARASFEGARAGQPHLRPFIVTRAGYAGVQRYAAVWTGDNDSSWEHLADSVQMLLNLSVSGVAFCGADVGGFHYNTTGELLARWTQMAAFTPFFRNHSNLGTIPQEPWAFGPRIEMICRRAVELRYQLMPYLYGLFAQAHRRGTPIIRPLFWHYPNDPAAVAAGDQFLLGADLLIAPILRQGATARSVYLPAGLWYDFWSGEEHRGGAHLLAEAPLERIPVYVRAGAIIPFQAVQQFVRETRSALGHLHVWPGSGTELDWYEDDGNSLEYEQGAYCERRVALSEKRGTKELSFSATQGNRASAIRNWRVLLRAVPGPMRVKLGREDVRSGYSEELGMGVFEIPNQAEEFRVKWRFGRP